jgi:hypothetical protein
MRRFVVAVFACFLFLAPAPAAGPTVYVVLWFDTEDYVLPASDDAAKKLADWLTKEGVKATFKVVGEKARTLETRGRQDVIDALKKHEIGYHSNFHSVQPTPAQYLAPLGWDEGVAEFDRRERPGYDDVKRIFGQDPSCYGQPGSSWGPQSYGAIKKWGMPVYLDSGQHVGLDGKPFYYGGIFTLYNLTYTLRTNLDGEKSLKQAEERFDDALRYLRRQNGGIVSIYYHPCEFVHKQFWDGANFAKGANPPREKWKLPEAKTEEESKLAYKTFFDYIQYIKRFEDVKFITAREAAEIYKDDAAGFNFPTEAIGRIAKAVTGEINYVKCDDMYLSPSEVLYLLNSYYLAKVSGIDAKGINLGPTPMGPSSKPQINQFTPQEIEDLAKLKKTDPKQFLEALKQSSREYSKTDSRQFQRTALDVMDSLRTHGRVPGTIWFGSVGVDPESYLAALAGVVQLQAAGKPVPDEIPVRYSFLTAEKYVADDNPKLWGWVIFPPEFKAAPDMMALAKRQAWTIKPAVLHEPKK